MKGYDLSRAWFNFCFENPDMVKPIHTAIFFYACEVYNRLGKKEKFGFPTHHSMEAIGVKNFHTYGKALNCLVEWGFIRMVQKSRNQHTANIISICATSKKDIARGKALDEAITTHSAKQDTKQGLSTASIDKPTKQLNHKTNKPINQELSFDRFWNMYGLKKSKAKSMDKWYNLDDDVKREIFKTLPAYLDETPDVRYRKQPITYLTQRVWMDYENGGGYKGVMIDVIEARRRASVRYPNPSDEVVNWYMSEQGYAKKGDVWIVE